MTDHSQQGFATRAIHLGYDPLQSRALSPPLYLTSTYTQESLEAFDEIRLGERAATSMAARAIRRPCWKSGWPLWRAPRPPSSPRPAWPRSRPRCSRCCKAATRSWSTRSLRHGLHAVHAGPGAFRRARGVRRFHAPGDGGRRHRPQDPRRVFETPANPNLRLVDIQAVSAIARGKGLLTIVDNTFATPVLQRPLALGADLVLHSATKYLGGHGDLLAGAVAARNWSTRCACKGCRYYTGATLSPFTAFLVLRGLKTLELRVQRQQSALRVARLLRAHPAVADVFYPGLADTAGAEIARRQQSAGGGLVAFELKGGLDAGRRLLNGLKLARIAVSLGDPGDADPASGVDDACQLFGRGPRAMACQKDCCVCRWDWRRPTISSRT